MFKRIIDLHLEDWKNNAFRKPLLLRGARQVGKTYAIRKLVRRVRQICISGKEKKKIVWQKWIF